MGVYRFALRLAGGDDGAAEELAQETWVRGVERLPGFAWRSSLRTWLIGIAVNCWREQRRREARARPHAVPQADRGDGAGGWAELDLERGIAGLAPGYREVLLLHDVEGHTHAEIAELLGIDAGTSKSQLSRARRILRESLGEGRSGA